MRPGGTEGAGGADGSTGLWLEWERSGVRLRLPLDRPLVIGRDAGSDIRLADPTVSRRHAVVSIVAGQIVVDATGSSNGISLDGGRAERTTLGPGQSFRIGDAVLRVIPGQAPLMAGPTPADAYPHAAPRQATRRMPVVIALVAVVLIAIAGGGYAVWSSLDHSGSFSATGSLTTARCCGTATLLSDGHVLLVGGSTNSDQRTASAELYDPKTGTFSPTGSMTTPRDLHTATLLADGRVLITGGRGSSISVASAELYDPKTGTFTATGSMTTPREGHTATLLSDGRVLVAGGDYFGPVDGPGGVRASAELYDPKTGTFGPTGSMTTGRANHTATLLSDGNVLIAGGYGVVAESSANAMESFASAELYDPKTGAFSPTGSMATARAGGHTATLLPDGRVLVAGGWDNSSDDSIDSAELYDPSTGAFRSTGSMAVGRQRHTATLLSDGRVLIAGGEGPVAESGGNYGSFASAELFDPKTGTFNSTGTMTIARAFHSATKLSDGRVLIAGAADNLGRALAPAELYTP